MKSSSRSPLYFSAYPLKAITGASGNAAKESPYLKSVLTSSGKTKTSSRVRVFPMANPYKSPVVNNKQKTKDVEGSGEEWFNHYE